MKHNFEYPAEYPATRKVIHIAGPRDYERTGIADYAQKLVEAQKKLGVNAILLNATSDPPIHWSDPSRIAKDYKWPFDTLDIKLSDWTTHDIKEFLNKNPELLKLLLNHKTYSRILSDTVEQLEKCSGSTDILTEDEQRTMLNVCLSEIRDLFMEISQQKNAALLDKYIEDVYYKERRTPLIHLHLSPPYCGTVVSPSFLKKYHSVATVHEFQPQSHNKFNMLLQYMGVADRIIITDKSELIAADEAAPQYDIPSKAMQAAIPPNIYYKPGQFPEFKTASARNKNIVQFTMFRPRKGIESVLELQGLLQQDPKLSDIETTLVGAIKHPDYLEYWCDILKQIYDIDSLPEDFLKDYAIDPCIFSNQPRLTENETQREKLLAEALRTAEILQDYSKKGVVRKKLNVTLVANASEQEVGELLLQSRYAYLPFDRGATARSGSLPTCVSFGCVTLTTCGDMTTDELKNSGLIFTQSPKMTLRAIKLLESNLQEADAQQETMLSTVKVQDWKKLAAACVNAYTPFFKNRDYLKTSKFRLPVSLRYRPDEQERLVTKDKWLPISKDEEYHEINSLLIERYAIGDVSHISIPKIGGSSGNCVYKISTPYADYLLKSFRLDGYSVSTIEHQHTLADKLNESNFPVPKPIGPVVVHEGRAFILSEFSRGEHKTRISPLEQKTIMTTLAKLHMETTNRDAYHFPSKPLVQELTDKFDSILQRKETLIQNLERFFGRYRISAENQLNSARRTMTMWAPLIEKKLEGLPESILHYDFSQHNILFKDNRIEAILDFDSSRWGKSIQDVVNTAIIIAKSHGHTDVEILSPESLKCIMTAVDDYQKTRKLTPKEKEAIPMLVALRALDSTIHRFNNLSYSPPLSKKLGDPIKKYKAFQSALSDIRSIEMIEKKFQDLSRCMAMH